LKIEEKAKTREKLEIWGVLKEGEGVEGRRDEIKGSGRIEICKSQ
jgi:hypothetical protein